MRKTREGEKEAGKSIYEITVMLITGIIWPVMLLGLLFLYREPIRAIAIQLPSLIASSSTISIAGVSVQVDRRLRSQASTDALAGLSALSSDGVRTVMYLSRAFPIYEAKDSVAGGRVDLENGELIKADLAKLEPADETRFGHGARMVRVTERGRQTQELVFVIIADFAGQIVAAAKTVSDSGTKTQN
jgi:hypothetical protein